MSSHQNPMEQLAAVALEHPEHLVERALDTAREMLDMEVAYLTEFTAGAQVFDHISGDRESFAIDEGEAIPLEETYCNRMVTGQMGNTVADARNDPALKDLDLTQRGDVGSYVGVPVQFSDGSVRGTLCGMSHSSDPAIAERDIRFMHLLARLVADELERQELREETDRLKDEFLALTSHELQTPLANVTGYLEMLREDEAEGISEDGARFLDAMDRNVGRLRRLVEQLLFVAQAQAGRLPEGDEDVNMAMVVRDAIAHKDIDAEIPDEPVVVHGDPDQLARLVDNLVSNAIKYTPDGGRVRVRLSSSGDDVRLEVEDEGIGIPEDEQDKLFQRFFRTSLSRKEHIQGVGLGLWIVRSIAQRHGGDITVKSKVGEGSTFTATLSSRRS